MSKRTCKILSLMLASLMLLGLFPFAALAEENAAIELGYGDYDFTKISNPTTGSGEPDGINTNDVTGFDANRLNSYAWAVASRGDYIYIGTNRTLFGSALNAVAEKVHQQNENITMEMMGKVVDFISGGDVPVNLAEEDYIPQIIKFDVKNGSTEVIYQPRTERGEDGILYYTDMDGNIIPTADVASETASFRSVIELNGNLYFGSLGANMLQLVRVDEEDNAKVVFQTIGLISSLRACCKYDDGNSETIYFGGQDTTYTPWLAYKQANPEDGTLPIVIRSLDPATAGTENEDWGNIIADFRDFGQYARASVYVAGGGNVWDLCSFNGKMYLILAYDRGWALFRGENVGKGEPDANEFGWKWTEIVGDDSIYSYPLAMDAEVGELNEQYRADYSCSEYTSTLYGSGLLESTATPYVYNGKMYIGSFDNATTIQSETVIKLLTKLQCMMNYGETSNAGPSLKQIFAPIYEVLSHQQHVWVMDENEQIVPVDSANELLAGPTNDYVWRFVEYDNKLYTGTFDSSTAFNYFLDLNVNSLLDLLQKNGEEPSAEVKAMRNGSYFDQIIAMLGNSETRGAAAEALKSAAIELFGMLRSFFKGDAEVEELIEPAAALRSDRELLREAEAEDDESEEIPEETLSIIDGIIESIDVDGLRYWYAAREIIKNAESGFDIFVTEDGESWEALVRDGLNDPYNYGARTFTICDGELFVGTANPYYGAQLWKITDNGHVLGEPTYVWSDDYTEVTATAVCENNPDHVVTEKGVVTSEVTKKATFDADGEIVYTAEFSNPAFETQTVTAVIPMLVLPCGNGTECPGAAFTDMPAKNHWAHNAIDWAVVNGITAGTSATTFSPDADCTRAQVVTFIWTAAGRPEPTIVVNPFTDVKASDYYYKAVLWALESGITAGTSSNTFSPDLTCTRAQIVTFIWAAAGRPTPNLIVNPFTDVKASDYYYNAVLWAVENAVTAGTTKTTFSPDAVCTRAQIVTFLYRADALK